MVPAWNGYCFPRWSGRLIRRVTAGPVGKESRPTGITQAAQVSRRCGRGKLDPDLIGPAMAGRPGVAEVHDLHIWDVTSGMPALSAHILVDPTGDCHDVRRDIEVLLKGTYRIDHTTLQVDHVEDTASADRAGDPDCEDPHGPRHQPTHPGPSPDNSAARPH